LAFNNSDGVFISFDSLKVQLLNHTCWFDIIVPHMQLFTVEVLKTKSKKKILVSGKKNLTLLLNDTWLSCAVLCSIQ
jgi:hypothetical protein